MLFITKGQGAVLATLPIAFYIVLYYAFVSGNTLALQLTLLYSLGVLFVFFRVLEEPEELMFFDKGTGGWWEEGWCLVPSFLPFVRNIGIHFPFGLRNKRRRSLEENRDNVNVHHYVDQRDMSYRVNVETTLLAANANRFFGALFGWFFGYNRGKPELLFQRIGFRIMLVAFLLGWFTNQTTSIGGVVGKYNPFKNETFNATVQLNDGVPHAFPVDNLFFWKKGMRSFSLEGDESTLFVPYEEMQGKIPMVPVKTKLCATVAAGQRIAFDTRYKPVYAVNMRNDVVYVKKYEGLNPLQQLAISVGRRGGDSKDYKTSDTWAEISRIWEYVESEHYAILAQALNREDLRDKSVLGGMVCF